MRRFDHIDLRKGLKLLVKPHSLELMRFSFWGIVYQISYRVSRGGGKIDVERTHRLRLLLGESWDVLDSLSQIRGLVVGELRWPFATKRYLNGSLQSWTIFRIFASHTRVGQGDIVILHSG